MHRETTMGARPLIEWRAVFGGAVLGLAFFALLSTLWVALAYGSDIAQVATNIQWFIAGSAIFAMFFGGHLAGLLSGVRGGGAGFFNGSTVWAMILLVGLSVGVPTAGQIFNVTTPVVEDVVDTATISSTTAWAAFFSLLIGFAAAAIGGIMGGASRSSSREIVLDDDMSAVPAHEHRGGAVVPIMSASSMTSVDATPAPTTRVTPGSTTEEQRRAM